MVTPNNRLALAVRTVLSSLLVAGLSLTVIQADYMIPPFPDVLEEVTSVVDATVVEFMDGGRVRIEVHSVLKGSQPPIVLAGAHYTCLGIDLSRHLKLTQRYIFMLYGEGLYEENSAFETRAGNNGIECNCWDGSEDYQRRWMLVSEFHRLIEKSETPPD